MSTDPAQDMPVVNWRTTGSFPKPVTPPSAGPLDGTLIQLPCINVDWLLLVMGCLDQLRVPAVWSTASDADTDNVLFWVTQLQETIWGAIGMACSNCELRFTSDCVLQFSTDGGDTWSDVSGWSDNFKTCVQTLAPVDGAPPNPADQTRTQMACSVADYLAIEVIKAAMQKAKDAGDESATLIQYALNIAGFIPEFRLVGWGLEALLGYYDVVNGIHASDFAAALTDATLWAEVKCAIYTAILSVGWVTDANCAAVAANIHAIGYSPSDVQDALDSFVSSIGCEGLKQLQQPAGLDLAADCSTCGNFCYYFDFTASDGGWVPQIAGQGTWVSGTGWTDQLYSGASTLQITRTFDPRTLTYDDLEFIRTEACGTGDHRIFFYKAGVEQAEITYDGNIHISQYGDIRTLSVLCDQIYIHSNISSTTGHTYIKSITIKGQGSNPFGFDDNCV